MRKQEKDMCEINCHNELVVRKVQQKIAQENITSMTSMFKVLADETRMKIAFSLSEEDELCVCDVANIIGSSMATASHHLRMLRQLGLAKGRKEGKLVFYSLEDDHVRGLIQLASTHAKELIVHG
jgi:ArsR family transcriptional regulator, lead/cadmium/zinc/bismuth-responsive transcriptional repressor